MSKIPRFAILSLALSFGAGFAQTTKPFTEGDLFKSLDQINADQLDTKPQLLQDEKSQQPAKSANQTEITSDTADFNNKTHIAIFTGTVVVVNPDFTCNCDKLTAYLKHDEKPAPAPGEKAKPAATPAPEGAAPAKSKGGLEKAHAEMTNGGKVLIFQDKKEADGSTSRSTGKGDTADYNAVTGEITLIGWPEVTQGMNSSIALDESTKMVMTRDGRMRSFGGRSKVIIQDNSEDKKPRAEKSAPNKQ